MRSRRAGMTLIEVVITIALLTLTLFPIYGLLINSRRAVNESRLYALARQAMESQIERYQAVTNMGPQEFGTLAQSITNAPQFPVNGLPPYRDSTGTLQVNHGRVLVCLNETKRRFVVADAPYWGVAPWNLDAEGHNVYPTQMTINSNLTVATGLYADLNLVSVNLNADRDGLNNPVFSALLNSDPYRLLPIRLEVYWGNAQLNAADLAPKVHMNFVLGPKQNFNRS